MRQSQYTANRQQINMDSELAELPAGAGFV